MEGHSLKVKGLKERLKDSENVICAEGYLWELEKRGYLTSGVFAPEVVLDYPERVRNLHEEFVHAGSDVVEAFTYHGHRAKMRLIGREDDSESLNLAALKIAREVADKTGSLMAGNLNNTNIYDPDKPEAIEEVKSIFKEQVEWAVKGKADYIIGETFDNYAEAKLALEAIQEYGNGLPSVITLVSFVPDRTTDELPFPVALKQLEEGGADVVGLNCGRGPATMLPLLKEIRRTCKGPIAALPVPFRTSAKEKCFSCLTDPHTGIRCYPTELAPCLCTRSEVRQFATEAREVGVQYIGLCCGSSSYLLRELAVAYGRNPPAMRYQPDLRRNITVGDKSLISNRMILKKRAFASGEIQ